MFSEDRLGQFIPSAQGSLKEFLTFGCELYVVAVGVVLDGSQKSVEVRMRPRPERFGDQGSTWDVEQRRLEQDQGVDNLRGIERQPQGNDPARGMADDVGTLDAYYQANIDLVNVDPELNLYDESWPIRTLQPQSPPPKFVHAANGPVGHARRGEALDSIVSPGCIISGGHVSRSVLSPKVRVNSYAVVEDSILLEGVDVGRYCRIRRAIIDKWVKLPPYTVLGYDLEFDRRRGFTVTQSGVVVVAKGEPPEAFQAPNPLPF